MMKEKESQRRSLSKQLSDQAVVFSALCFREKFKFTCLLQGAASSTSLEGEVRLLSARDQHYRDSLLVQTS